MKTRLRRLLPAGLLIAAVVALVNLMDWDDHLWNQWMQWRHADEAATLHGNWVLDAPPKALPATGGELSGLTWSGQSNSLFAVRNRPAAVLELSLEGELLREISVPGLQDPEAIVWLEDNRFAIADERSQTLYSVSIDPRATELDLAQAVRLSLSIELNGNKGFEGLAYDRMRQRLYVAKEREPQRIYAIDGYTGRAGDQLDIRRLDQWQGKNDFFMDDFSGLQLVPETGHLLVLSDESALIAELNEEGELIAFLELDEGFAGLEASVPQAEGLTMDGEQRIYLLSEPDLFYRFRQES